MDKEQTKTSTDKQLEKQIEKDLKKIAEYTDKYDTYKLYHEGETEELWGLK